jgi:hypothetical protein
MRSTSFLKRLAVAIMVGLLAAGSAFADRDGKDGNKGGGGNRDGGNRGNASVRSDSNRGNASVRSGTSGSSRSITIDRDSRGSSDSNRVRTFRDGDSDRDGRSIQLRTDQTGKAIQGSRDYQVRRPTDDSVRNFLNLPGNTNNNAVRRTRERSPQERAMVDREFKDWRNTWNGQKGDGRDTRDWSNSWRDSDRFTTADRIRNDWRSRKDNDRIFGGDWWRHRRNGNYWTFWGDYASRYHRPWYWWSWATGPRLGSWIVFGWPTPYYWDYGPGEYLYYNDGMIYVNGRPYEPAPAFYNQTLALVDQGRLDAEAAARMEWMPLGVFAVTPDGVAEPDVVVQVAVTKDGVIGGTAFDQRSGSAFNLYGMVDKRTQRAVFGFTNDRSQRLVLETSIFNLTQSAATGMVHYGPNDMRVVELVRLQDPSSGQAVGTAADTLPPPPISR